MRLYALRGATTVAEDERQAILDATSELMQELLTRNELSADALVSCLFTLTPDLHAEFPAAAAREIGLSSVPLMCARELDVHGTMPPVTWAMAQCPPTD